MRLITENKWKQDCGVRRYDLGLRRSHRLMFKMICERLPKDTSPGRGMSYLAWQEHDRGFAPSSADGGVQPACISLVFSGIQAMESFSKGEPFPGVPCHVPNGDP